MTTYPQNIDFIVRFERCSTIWTFDPITDEARAWVAENLSIEDWQWVGSAFGVDHRIADQVLQIMLEDGLRVFHPALGFANCNVAA